MSGKKLLMYLAVLVLVAGGYFVSEFYHSRRAVQEKAAKQLFQVKADDITALTLKSDKGEIRVERVTPPAPRPTSTPATPTPEPQAGEWRITKPIAVRADTLTINSVLDALAELNMQRQLGDLAGDKLKEFGLEKPLFTVEFQAAGKTQLLRFGNKAPGGQTMYAQKDTEPRVLLIRLSDKETLDRTLTALRTKEIFSIPPDKVTELRVIRNQERLIFQKAAPAGWTPGDHNQTKLRTDKINALLNKVTGAKALEFVAEKADDLKKYGLAPSPTLRLTLMSGNQEQTLLLGSKQGDKYYAQISGTSPIILVDKALLENLPASYESLEDRRLWSGPDADVQKVVWGAPDKQITAVRDTNGWNIQTPDGKSHQEAAMKFSLAFWRLKDMEFIRLLNSTEDKKTAPIFTFQLLGTEDKPRFRLEELATEKDQVRITFTQGEKTAAALIPAKSLTHLKETLAGLVQAAVPQSLEKPAAAK